MAVALQADEAKSETGEQSLRSNIALRRPRANAMQFIALETFSKHLSRSCECYVRACGASGLIATSPLGRLVPCTPNTRSRCRSLCVIAWTARMGGDCRPRPKSNHCAMAGRASQSTISHMSSQFASRSQHSRGDVADLTEWGSHARRWREHWCAFMSMRRCWSRTYVDP